MRVKLNMALAGIGARHQVVDLPDDVAHALLDRGRADAFEGYTDEGLDSASERGSLPAQSVDTDPVPNSHTTRAEIDAYGERHGIDTSNADTKAGALAMLGVTEQ